MARSAWPRWLTELLFVGGFAEGAAEGGVVEQRVVAETARAAGFVDDAAFDCAAEGAAARAPPSTSAITQTNRAVRFSDAPSFSSSSRLLRSSVASWAGEARGMDAGSAAERVHLQAGIVGEQQAGACARVVRRLEDGVLFEGGAVSSQGGMSRNAADVDLDVACAGGQAELPQLAGVAGGALRSSSASRPISGSRPAPRCRRGPARSARHLRVVERRVFGGGLHFDELAGAGHHHVHIDVGLRVLFVAEVQHAARRDDPDAGGGHVIADRRLLERAEIPSACATARAER